jgi:hypothetical protein
MVADQTGRAGRQTIRVPALGKTAGSRRIAEAVDDQGWQEFRLSLKGISTRDKLDKLEAYYKSEHHTHVVDDRPGGTLTSGRGDCDVCIRFDNYLKALARGGQLYGGISLIEVVGLITNDKRHDTWSNCVPIKRN